MTKGKFVYKPRSVEQVQRQAELRGGLFDSCYQEGVEVWKCNEGNHQIRIMPPTWENPEDFGLMCQYHSQVGPDNQTYLCPNRMKVGPCPLCEEASKFQKQMDEKSEKDKKILYGLKGYRRCLVWLIDRDDEATGPQLYPMPWGLSRDINMISVHPRTKKLLAVDDPDRGFDVLFTRKGTTQTNTEYLGAQLDQQPTPISEDAGLVEQWMDFIIENPLPKVLKFFSYEHIVGTIEGRASKEEPEEEEAPPPKSRSSRADPDEEHEVQRKEFRKKVDEGSLKRPLPREEEEPEEVEAEEEEARPLRDKIRSKLASRRSSKDDE